MYPETYWNYRMCTFIYQPGSLPPERYFDIREVYYRKGVLDSYSSFPTSINYLNSIEEIKEKLTYIQEALNEPIIDLDNWPNEYTP